MQCKRLAGRSFSPITPLSRSIAGQELVFHVQPAGKSGQAAFGPYDPVAGNDMGRGLALAAPPTALALLRLPSIRAISP